MKTPTGQTICPRTPPTPRHGPAALTPSPADKPKRRLRRTDTASSEYSASTLSPPPSSPMGPSSPVRTRKQHKKATFKVSHEGVLSEMVREEEEEGEEAEERTEERPTLVNPSGIGLPTPAKTPSRKRKLATEDITASSKLLFPSASRSSQRSTTTKSSLSGAMPSSRTPTSARRGRMNAGTIQVEEIVENPFEVYTDASARIPQRDSDPDNPFISRPGEEAQSSKRKRQQRADRRSNRLGEDAKREDGMVYVFRGKKIFKKFTEVLGPDSHASDDEDGLKPSSIKPRLLFPSSFTRSHDAENGNGGNINVEDEEAETDIENGTSNQLSVKLRKGKDVDKRDVSRMTPDSEGEIGSVLGGIGGSKHTPKTPNKRRIPASRSLFDDGEDGDPFDSPVEDPGEEEIVIPRGQKRGFEAGPAASPVSTRKRMRPVRRA